MEKRKVFAIGETVFDIIFKNNKPIDATPGGAMLNTAVSLGRIGLPAFLVGDYARDAVGKIIDNYLQENNVRTDFVNVYDNARSRLALAFLNDDNDADYSFYKIRLNGKASLKIPPINENDIVLFGSFYGIKTDVREDLMHFINQAREKQALIFYDPNFRAAHLGILNEVMPFIEENIQKCSIVKGSNEDFYNMFNLDNPEEVYTRISNMGQQNLIYTANKHGVTLITKNIHKHYPVEDINTKSTVGAGDSFNAGLIYACIKHDVSVQNLNELRAESWDDIIAIAIEFASHVCLSTQNCVSLDFARRMKYEAFKQ